MKADIEKRFHKLVLTKAEQSKTTIIDDELQFLGEKHDRCLVGFLYVSLIINVEAIPKNPNFTMEG